MSFTYDAGALVAADRNDRRMMALHYRILQRGWMPTVPGAVLSQAWRGGPQPGLSRLLAGCQIDAAWSEALARRIGAACATAGSTDVVDGLVVLTALDRADTVLTSDPGDLHAIAAATGRRLDIVAL